MNVGSVAKQEDEAQAIVLMHVGRNKAFLRFIVGNHIIGNILNVLYYIALEIDVAVTYIISFQDIGSRGLQLSCLN
jgi:hypothetical protein